MVLHDFIRARKEARKLARTRQRQLPFARRFIAGLISQYLPDSREAPVQPLKHPLCEDMGNLARQLDDELAAYLIGTTYTALLPEHYRSQNGVFYTPPGLTNRLLMQAERAGVDWATARVVDPACGGGAFLAPAAKRMAAALGSMRAEDKIRHIETHLHGQEIDAFGAWMTQVFVEKALEDVSEAAGRPINDLVQVGDSLSTTRNNYNAFDLVIGNPPYGRVSLSPAQRAFWKRSLYGHANLYSLFCDLAVRMCAPRGVVAYVTPTSFLGGQYFQALRSILADESPPVSFDFISRREGVFEDVLQETLLSVYKRGGTPKPVSVSYLAVEKSGDITARENGQYSLPAPHDRPWIFPRAEEQAWIARWASHFDHTLRDLGYKVSTGPLVWNRHKGRLHKRKVAGAVPVIWAECVSPSGNGEFTFKATRNHCPWFKPDREDDPNIVTEASVLVQRTTALEQRRRLVAAELPQSFIDEHSGSVTVENHLNMIRRIPGREALVSSRVIAALLNSHTVDTLFRCINGSTAVSAYELEAMPLPSPESLKRLDGMIARGAKPETLEKAIRELYEHVCRRSAA